MIVAPSDVTLTLVGSIIDPFHAWIPVSLTFSDKSTAPDTTLKFSESNEETPFWELEASEFVSVTVFPAAEEISP